MNDFMKFIAPKVWPTGNRTMFCYGDKKDDNSSSCIAKNSNPFGPYWKKFDVDFNKEIFFGYFNFKNDVDYIENTWMFKYSPKQYPVLAFSNAPATFPIVKENVPLQQYLKWSSEIELKAYEFLEKFNKLKAKMIGIHLRNGGDFVSIQVILKS